MGMFDSFYDSEENEWQTKAYENQLALYRQGDELPPLEDHPNVTDYQVEIFGGRRTLGEPVDSFATVIGNRLTTINTPRNKDLPRINYGGAMYHPEAERELELRADK
ncbi:hypothetical protein [Glutamicibacter ardleyensis]|uniref:Uncharacterized protein n=1 Tax=Glutamicibacter ardleyensis TaxID=225894 RepID=A0ABQ2DI11_9MICC|nr:hypothetical protein [Glutamicibacter ardleyensis]GGJ56076.1 hypothetical protein GCM10007173_13610 [Glutamicibacter ardleyensis]